MEENENLPSISEDEASQIIEKKLQSKDFEIDHFNLELLGEWVGLCGDHANLKIKLKQPDEEYSFFVKLYPRVQFVIDFIEGTGSFKKEIFVYKLLNLFEEEGINLVEECVPRCYLTVPNKFLVLDNLLEDDYTSVNKYETFDYETIRTVLNALAKLHASSLIYEEKKSSRLFGLYADDLEETYFNDRDDFPSREGIEAAITGILNSLQLFNFPEKLISGKNFRTVLEQVCRKVYTLAKPSETFRNVLCHGDIWATNVLIKRDDSGKSVKCKLVDFQCGRYAPPAQDVMAVIYLTTSREFRKKYMYHLIGTYYTNLEKLITLAGFNMKEIIPFDEFLMSCERQKPFALVQTAVYFPLILLESQVVQDYFGNEEKNREALLVDRSILIKEQIEGNEVYKNRIIDCLQDLKEYCDYL